LSRAGGTREEREYRGKGASTLLPLFLGLFLRVAGEAIVLLLSPLSACGLRYGSSWTQPKKHSDDDNELADVYDEMTRGGTVEPERGPFQNYVVSIFLDF
jgi:hypothetical protein